MDSLINRLPPHGAYAVFDKNKLVSLIGYNLETHEAVVVYAIPKVEVPGVDSFVSIVRAQGIPEPRQEITGPDRWELYGLPSRDNGTIPLLQATEWWWEKLHEHGARD